MEKVARKKKIALTVMCALVMLPHIFGDRKYWVNVILAKLLFYSKVEKLCPGEGPASISGSF
jgi:hypothetical protein